MDPLDRDSSRESSNRSGAEDDFDFGVGDNVRLDENLDANTVTTRKDTTSQQQAHKPEGQASYGGSFGENGEDNRMDSAQGVLDALVGSEKEP